MTDEEAEELQNAINTLLRISEKYKSSYIIMLSQNNSYEYHSLFEENNVPFEAANLIFVNFLENEEIDVPRLNRELIGLFKEKAWKPLTINDICLN